MRRLIFLLALLIVCAFLSCTASADVTYQGMTYPDNTEYVDLGDLRVTDFDALESFIDQLPWLQKLDMFGTEMLKRDCDRLADRYPNIEFGWTLKIVGKDHNHLVRTDATSFSTLHNNKTSHHYSEDFEILRYCKNLLALDVGHNSVTSLDFLYDLPKLRVLIIACNQVEDITPIACLRDLEYAELFKNRIRDLEPLTDLPHMLDLNVCFNSVEDWSPITSLTTLTRLWLYNSCTYRTGQNIPKSEVAMLKAALPNTQVDSTHYSTAGTWRTHPHYKAIQKTFGERLHPSNTYYPFEDSFYKE